MTRRPDVQEHPLIVGLLDELPAVEEGFDEKDREAWLHAFKVNLGVIYRRSEEEKL